MCRVGRARMEKDEGRGEKGWGGENEGSEEGDEGPSGETLVFFFL